VKRIESLKRLKDDPGTWFHATGILALLGAALTANFVVDYAKQSPAPLLVATVLITALLLSLVIVVWNRNGHPMLRWMILGTVGGGIATYLQLPSVLNADPFPNLSPYLVISFWVTVCAALLTVGLGIKFEARIYNPEITPIKNGITLIGVLFSALAFNLDPSWGPWIGWPIIAVTLFSLAPIWRSEAEAEAHIAKLQLTINKLENDVKNRKATPGKGGLLPKGSKGKGKKK
jgi:hypothetical protein